jgi:hypothetical protein
MGKITRWSIGLGLSVWMAGPSAPVLAQQIVLQGSRELANSDDHGRYEPHALQVEREQPYPARSRHPTLTPHRSV